MNQLRTPVKELGLLELFDMMENNPYSKANYPAWATISGSGFTRCAAPERIKTMVRMLSADPMMIQGRVENGRLSGLALDVIECLMVGIRTDLVIDEVSLREVFERRADTGEEDSLLVSLGETRVHLVYYQGLEVQMIRLLEPVYVEFETY